MLIGVGSHAAKAPGRGLRLRIAPPSTAGSTTRGGPAYKSTSHRTQTGRTVSPILWIVYYSYCCIPILWLDCHRLDNSASPPLLPTRAWPRPPITPPWKKGMCPAPIPVKGSCLVWAVLGSCLVYVLCNHRIPDINSSIDSTSGPSRKRSSTCSVESRRKTTSPPPPTPATRPRQARRPPARILVPLRSISRVTSAACRKSTARTCPPACPTSARPPTA